MEDFSAPYLNEETKEQIEVDQYEVHQKYHTNLSLLPLTISHYFEMDATTSRLMGAPRPPKQSAKVTGILRMYARELFDIEARHYKPGPQYRSWLENLARRICSIVQRRFSEIDGVMRRLSSHVSDARIAESVTNDLRAHIQFLVDAEGSKKKEQQVEEQRQKSAARRAVVEPILDRMDWSTSEWAQEANVSFHTAHDYLSGKTEPVRHTRNKLAKALRIPVSQLP